MSAGNSGQDISSIPAYPSFLRIGATDQNDDLASFSNYGRAVDFVAPGVSILTTSPNGKYTYISGTSFSSPLSAGVAALIFSIRPDLKPMQVAEILKISATDIGSSYYFGRGRVDASEALKLARTFR
ncbi:MAG: S8 family serine peptidase [Bdellovibrio sp.]|nr:S8 family serine peptidase [Bdellovibrio sp.]